ncbi:MAG: CoA-binding protein [Lysobacterales bacterium]|nr:MAG: CoA-binding protein [Xanthomonadales bacterium]
MSDDIPTIRRILKENHTVAMVGLSADWFRPSFFAAKYLKDHGFRVIPVNPRYVEILGEKCYARVQDIPDPIDVVDCFRRAEDIPLIAEAAIEVGAKVLWMQLGIVNEEAAATARQAGLEVIMNRCMKIEFARMFGGLNFIGVNTKIISAKRPMWVPY